MPRPFTRRVLCALFVASAILLAGCATEDVQQRAEDVRERATQFRERAEGIRRDADDVRRRVEELQERAHEARERADKVSKRLRRRVRRVLDELRQSVPAASRPLPASQERTEDTKVTTYLDEVIGNIDAYWTTTLTQSGVSEPRVGFHVVREGEPVGTGCRVVADDAAAFYCTGDDTIYIAERLASDLWEGISDDFPGQQAGYGRAVGDFGLAYVVAHEYAHNVQNELGFYELQPRGGVRVFELQADCMAGLWGNSVYRAGKIKPGDVEEAMNTALAAGDFDYSNENHHGTPQERRDAWLLGFETGEPARCQEMVA